MQQKENKGAFQWRCQPQAEELVAKTLASCCEKNQFLNDLQKKLWEETSTRLFDWVDHIEIGYSDLLQRELEQAGFIAQLATPIYRVFAHPGAQLPFIVVKDQSHPFVGVAISVDSIADFLMVRGLSTWIGGAPLSGFRSCCVSKEQGVFVYIIERRGVITMEPTIHPEEELNRVLLGYEKWKTRSRKADDEEQEEEEMRQAIMLAEELVETLGFGLAAHIVLDVERKYWQAKNIAGQVQKSRQDRLGLGWANHDHHTFRSSRRFFRELVRLFEILGFTCRERFYAGKEAGWGAQVMEHKTARLVLFLDVDLSPEEVDIDFAHLPLEEKPILGTVGLWCALHGESILKSGMHHLEAQFDFEKLEKDLTQRGVKLMDPFTNLGFLKQAFTVAEKWPVASKRIQRLLERALITKEQAERFSQQGALGSHLENLQRKQGYKGFHQKSVSDIIHKTDPRGA